MQIFERISAILRENLGLNEGFEITPSTEISALGADSLDLAEILMCIEDMFDIEIPEDAERELHTVGDAVALVEKLTE